MKGKKGQAVFEFIIAAILFFSIIFYILNFLFVTVATYNTDFVINDLESKSVQISELLVKDKGVWIGQKPSIVGLASLWPILNFTKIDYLDNYCDDIVNYTDLIDNFNLGSRKFNITITGANTTLDGKDWFDCGLSVPDVPKAKTDRFAVLDSTFEIIKVTVWVW